MKQDDTSRHSPRRETPQKNSDYMKPAHTRSLDENNIRQELRNNTRSVTGRNSYVPSGRQKKSPLVIVGLMLIILAALLALIFIYMKFFMVNASNSSSPQVTVQTASPEVEMPAETVAPAEISPSVTESPAIAQTPEPAVQTELVSSFTPLHAESGYLAAQLYDGHNFYSFTWDVSEDSTSANLHVWRAVRGVASVTDFIEITDDSITPAGPDARRLADGNLLMRSDAGISVVDSNGSVVREISCSGYPTALIGLSNGRIGAVAWTDRGQELFTLDESSWSLTDGVLLPDSARLFADGSGEYLCYYTSDVNFVGLKSDGTGEVLFNWTAMDVSPSRIACITPQEDGSFACVVNCYDAALESYDAYLVTIAEQEAGTAAEKTKLTLLSLNPVDTLTDAVMDYNRSSETARIVLHTLSVEDEDIITAIRSYANDELDGNLPDLYDLTGMPYEAMTAAGLLEDLYPYMDKDDTLSRADVLAPVLSGLEIGGKLYGTSGGFTVNTVVGPQKVLGDISGWTYAEYTSLTSTMGEGTYAFGAYDTQSAVLNDLLGLNLSSFVDWNAGTCSFETDSFTSLLEFLRKFPSEPRDTNDEELVSSGIQLLLRTSLYSAEDMAYVATLFDSPAYVGLPQAERRGTSLNLFKDYAVSSSCADKDAAWQFVRTSFLTADTADLWYFSSNRTAYEAQLQAAQEQGGITETEIATLQALIENGIANRCSTEIYNLVLENIQGYLDGRDTAAGAAKYVQDAVTAYLNSLKA